MRFCDLFISYQIGLKELKSTIPFIKLPLYRKIGIVGVYSIGIIFLILFVLKLEVAAIITFAIGVLGVLIFMNIDAKNKNLAIMLNEHYAPYSKKRMKMVINILEKYKIDIQDLESIDLLILETQKAQNQYDYLAPLKKPLQAFGGIIIPIAAYVAKKICDTTSQNQLISIAFSAIILIFLFFSLSLSLSFIIKDALYSDYNKCDELIYDLRQIKIFYSKNNTVTSN